MSEAPDAPPGPERGPEQFEESPELDEAAAAYAGGRRRVLLVHGVMGSQLVDRAGLIDDVVWFDLHQLLYNGGLDAMQLTPDGASDATPGVAIEASRPLRIVYDLLGWHLSVRGGFSVEMVAYDWRKHVDAAAMLLHTRIEALAAGDRSARFSVVAHSMGGVVTLRYAALFGEAARRRLEQVVFMGVPVHGCFEPFELYAGVHNTAARVDRVAPGRGERVRQVFASFPGIAELCADSARFDSGHLLDPAYWPDLPALHPWLPHSRAWRARYVIPDWLLDRLDVILSANRDTCDGLWRGPAGVERRWAAGDGTVAVPGAWCVGARGHHEALAHHPMLPLDARVRAGVVALLHSHGASAGPLPRVAGPGALIGRDVPPGLLPRPAEPHAIADGVRARTTNGEVVRGDAMWLLGGEAGAAAPGGGTSEGAAAPGGGTPGAAPPPAVS